MLIRSYLYFISKELHNQWNELQEKLYDEVIIPLTAYQSQFPDIKVFDHWYQVLFLILQVKAVVSHTGSLFFNLFTHSLTHRLCAKWHKQL